MGCKNVVAAAALSLSLSPSFIMRRFRWHNVSGSGSATGKLGHYGSHPRPQVADRETPSRMDKRVAPDKEGAADKQCLRRRKTLIPNRGRWSSLSLFRQST